MTDDLVERLRDIPDPDTHAAAERIEAMTAQLAEDADARALVDARLDQLVAQVDALTTERDAALAEVEQWRLSHGHLDQLAVDLSVRLIIAGVWPKPMHEGEDGTEAEYIACCANILEAVGRLTAERDRLRGALAEWDALIEHQYSGSREAMSAMTSVAQKTAKLLKGETP